TRTGFPALIFLSFRALAAISRSPAAPTPLEARCGENHSYNQGLIAMATVNELSATARPKAGKGAARAVRREGRVPGVIYGDNKEPVTISLDFKELRHRIY